VLEAVLNPTMLELLGDEGAIIIDEEVELAVEEKVVVGMCPG